MATRKHSPRAYRPEADQLEGRQLLSGVVSGVDVDGDTWSLRLIGPGALSVTKQNVNGSPAPLGSQTEINTIVIGGTDPFTSRLVGTVHKGAAGDGKVFFETFKQIPGRSQLFGAVGQSLLAIDMPNFWLGTTSPPTTSTTTTNPTPSMLLPDGVVTLRFGGVDTTHNQVAATSTTQSDTYAVDLGLPPYGGSRILIDKSISSSQTAPPASGSTTPRTVQHGVTFAVSGRLELFQANEIVGDKNTPPGQFGNQNSNATGSGGTSVVSTLAATTPFFVANQVGFKGTVGGQIGNFRVGGDATNLTVIAEDPTGSGIDRISNFSVGGETNNVLMVAPNGSRNVVFGKGMDNVEIRSHVINTLKANRGAVNSTVAVDRTISLVDFGGDVVGTRVLTGYVQNYTNIINTITGQSNSIFSSASPAPPPLPENAQVGGGMVVHVAGDVNNSVFTASVEPFNDTFGDPNQVVLPLGEISAKVEGTIDNSTETPSTPNQAFFAQHVKLTSGPVTPPGVPEPPYSHNNPHPKTPGLRPTPAATSASRVSAASAASASPTVRIGAVTPKGPGTSQTAK